YSERNLSPPNPSSTNTGVSFTPFRPPAALNSSIQSSAAAFAGTPKTEAAPDVNVVMPILSSAGFVPCPNALEMHPNATARVTNVRPNFVAMISPPNNFPLGLLSQRASSSRRAASLEGLRGGENYNVINQGFAFCEGYRLRPFAV